MSLLLPAVWAQDYEGRVVDAVRIEGLERVSEQVVRARLEVQAGQPWNPRAISRDIRRLYGLGFFTHISADAAMEDGRLIVAYQVQEKRVVAELRILGNKKIKDRRLRSALSLREGDSFVPEVWETERESILAFYESKGFANAVVEMIVERIGPSRVRITYDIEEGRKARIRKIRFVGNDALTRRQLKKEMKTRRAFWFFGGKYQEEKLETDLQNIVGEYGNHGRLEADVPRTDIFYTDNGKDMEITVFLEEGPEYHVKNLELANNAVFDDDELLETIDVHAGELHNRGQVNEDAGELTSEYQDSGYVDAIVTPQVTLDKEEHTTWVVHNVSEGDLKYLREIKITGNMDTRDEVIRRELLLNPDGRYDGGAVEASRRRLENTRYFDTVRLTLEDLPDDLYNNLLVDVEEGKTGTFNFGAGYNTEEGMGGFAELNLNNFDITNWPRFSGGGQQFRIRLHLGDVRDQYSISFTEPEIFGYPISGGIDLFNESYRMQGGADYREDQRGAQIRFGKMLSDYVIVRNSYKYQETDLSELPFFINRDIRRQRGDSTTISTRWQIERNTIDRFMDPSSGARHLLSSEIAGLGGDHNFLKLEHDSIWYHPFGEEKKWVGSLRVRNGWMTEYGGSDYIPLQDRFYAGGTTTVRGYDFRDIGPRQREFLGGWGDWFATGGDMRLILNTEMKYRVTKILRLFTFVDGGGVWEDASDLDPGDMRYSAGIGLGFDIPQMGPIRVDYGFTLNPGEDQGSGRLHLTTGLSF
jgi:outer membrane protein insertion porin family